MLACRQAFGDFPPDVARFADGAAASGGLLFSTLSDFATQVRYCAQKVIPACSACVSGERGCS